MKRLSALLLLALLVSGCGGLPDMDRSGVSFATQPVERPDLSQCLNNQGGAGLAKELINVRDLVVVIGGGPDAISDEAWADFSPRFPWQKNLDRNTMFTDHCFYRSPSAPADCTGDACRVLIPYRDYSWVELSRIVGVKCFPSGDAGCRDDGVDPGAFAITTIEKCHQIVYEGEIYELADDRGNRFVMHANETGAPNLTDVALPPGWQLNRIDLDEPLEILPFGGEGACYHNVGRDNLNQGYHQTIFAKERYP